jgi:hypothetical protein
VSFDRQHKYPHKRHDGPDAGRFQLTASPIPDGLADPGYGKMPEIRAPRSVSSEKVRQCRRTGWPGAGPPAATRKLRAGAGGSAQGRCPDRPRAPVPVRHPPAGHPREAHQHARHRPARHPHEAHQHARHPHERHPRARHPHEAHQHARHRPARHPHEAHQHARHRLARHPGQPQRQRRRAHQVRPPAGHPHETRRQRSQLDSVSPPGVRSGRCWPFPGRT